MSSGYTSGDSCCDGVDQSSDIPSYSSSIPNVEGSNSSDNDVIGKWIIPTTEATLHTLKQYLESYRQYVAQNPIWVSEAESALYWVSYLLSTTRFHNSRIVSELLYSCSSLLTLFNDSLLRKSYSIDPNQNVNITRLQTVLSFIEYIQVFLELTALHMYGNYGKWIIISIVEVVKAMIRMILLFHYQQGLTRRHYLTPLNRSREFELHQMRVSRKEQEQIEEIPILPDAEDVPDNDECPEKIVDQYEVEMNSFKLPSSGRIIRNIDSAPPKSKRMWITPLQTIQLRRLIQKQSRTSPTITKLSRRRFIGEFIHIIRPIAHLSAGALCGSLDKWSPLMLSFSLDVISLRMLHGSNYLLGQDNLYNLVIKPSESKDDSIDPVDEVWNWSEQLEIQRRYLSLFMYLLRSPFYDKFTKERILRLLSLFANNIPLFGRLVRPFITYLPEWQRVYYRIWKQ
ncbi:hypothetical protein RDWZM_005006 [Blomia tropicalis]|uniref:Peroxisomal membrane protein PEX16 n=1 Tax=Blomia tropicalis TaxID=40697 RepID=A0A9Q0M5F5_BLOTA|nr:hypothetical protein RDWZM_005006 [Blomia tropicalis]